MLPLISLYDGSTQLWDWYLANEILTVKYENKERATEASKQK